MHVINLSEVNAYVRLTNTVLSRSSYVVMFILLTGIRYVLKTITNVAAVVYPVLDQLRFYFDTLKKNLKHAASLRVSQLFFSVSK